MDKRGVEVQQSVSIFLVQYHDRVKKKESGHAFSAYCMRLSVISVDERERSREEFSFPIPRFLPYEV